MEDTHERYRRTDLPALPAPHPERYVARRLSRRGFSVGSQHRNLLAVWFRRSRRTWRNPTRPMADRSEPTTRKTKLHRKVARTMNFDWRMRWPDSLCPPKTCDVDHRRHSTRVKLVEHPQTPRLLGAKPQTCLGLLLYQPFGFRTVPCSSTKLVGS